jgi:serine/threonine protein phosphatase PrpC
MLELEFSQASARGAERQHGEEAIGRWPHEDGLVFAIADGVGGAPGSQVASDLALEVLARELELSVGSWPLRRRLGRAVREANVAIYQKSITVPELRGMGATLTATALVGTTLVSAHVGNCRLYLLRHDSLAQLTKDHTWAWEQAAAGVLSEAQARAHEKRQVLTRRLGHELIVGVDVLKIDVRAGDVLAQCSDGVHGVLADDEIGELMAAHPPEAACRAILRRCREEDGQADASVQVATISAGAPAPRRAWWSLRAV